MLWCQQAGDAYGGAGTLHTSGMRYHYTTADGKISCDVSSIKVYFPELNEWKPLEYDPRIQDLLTFESTQNLSGLMPTSPGLHSGSAVPFAPHNGATGEVSDRSGG